jgi:hypothetical protein
MTGSFRLALALASAGAALAAPLLPSLAGPLPGTAPVVASPAALVPVGDWDDDDWDEQDDFPPHRSPHRGTEVVDAPFARVETGGRGRVAVDAPFTSVWVGRRGVWVRAPFVDIYVPK